jgi:hypothetical protein
MPEIDFSGLPDRAEVPQGLIDVPAETPVVEPAVAPVVVDEAKPIDFSGLPDKAPEKATTESMRLPSFDAAAATLPAGIAHRDNDVKDSLSLAAAYDISPKAAYSSRDKFKENLGETSLWDKAAGSIKAGMGDVYAGMGGVMELAGFEGESADVYKNYGERLRLAYIPPTDTSDFTYRKVIDPEWWATSVTRSIPFTLSLIPTAIVGAYAGGGGAGGGGFGAFGTTIMASLGGAAMSRPLESAFEAASAKEEALAKGMSEAEAEKAAAEVFKGNMMLVGLDAAQFATAFTPLRYGAGLKSSIMKRMAAGTGKLSAVAVSEAGEERYQEYLQLQALEEEGNFFDLDNPRLNEASTIGGIFGLGMGGAGSVWSSLTKEVEKEMPEEVRAVFDNAKSEAISEGLEEDVSNLRAFDAIAETPEGKEHIESVIDDLKERSEGSLDVAAPVEEIVEPIPTEEEAIERFFAGEITEEELADITEGVSGRITEEFPVSAPVAEIKQRLLDTGMSEEEATSNAALMGGFQSLAKQAGVPVEVLMERYLPEVTREGVEPVAEEEVLEQAQTQGFEGEVGTEAVEWNRAVEKGLDMSQQARLSRAEEMGFDIEQVWYHGTRREFSEFEASKPRGAPGNRVGIYFTKNKRTAEEYALNEGEDALDEKSRIVKVYLKEPELVEGDREIQAIIIDPSQIRSVNAAFDPEFVESAQILAQEAPQEPTAPGEAPRGRIRITPDGITIELLKGADASTFVHELGHLYFRMLADLSTLDTASESLKADFETLRGWLGVPEGAETVSREQQEQFARGFEAYLREGKAPSPALAEAFENFKQWLMEVYQNLRQLNVELTDDVRDVFDRLLADEGVEVAEREGVLPEVAGREATLEQSEIIYGLDHRPPSAEDGAPLHDMTGEGTIYPDDIYSANGLRYYGTGSDRADRESMSVIQSTKGKPNASVKMYRAVPHVKTPTELLAKLEKQMNAYQRRRKLPEGISDGSAWYDSAWDTRADLQEMENDPTAVIKKINNGDWVTLSRAYAKEHGESALNGEYKIISKSVKAKTLFTNGDSINEFGYWAVQPKIEEVLEQAASPELIDQREKDLQVSQKDDIYNTEETKRRIDNELYIHDRLPGEISSKELTGRIKDAQAIARGSLESVSEADAGPIDVNRNIIGRRSELAGVRKAEAKALKPWAEKNNLIIKSVEEAATGKKNLAGGQENYVFYSKSKDVWVKANRLEYTPTYNDLFDRVMLHNNQFPDTPYTFQGFATVRGEFMPVFSQQNRVDDAGITDVAKEKMAGEYLEELGYTKNPKNNRQWLKGDIVVQDIHAKNIAVQDDKVFIFDPVVFLNPETKSNRAIGESRGVPGEQVGEEAGLEDIGIEGVEVFDQPAPKVPVKTRVRKITGQVKDKELLELRDEFVRTARVAREAFRAGKEAVAQKETQKLKNIMARSRKVRVVRDYLNLTDADMKKLTTKNPLFMDQWEFKKFIDDLRVRAVELSENKLQKAMLIHQIYEKDLSNVDNYRKVLGFPTITKMTTEQAREFAIALDPFADGSSFLTVRQLQLIDRTELEGARTYEEAKAILSEKTDLSIEELSQISITEWTKFKWDTALAESDPFLNLLVRGVNEKLLEANIRSFDIETKVHKLAKKSEKSRARTFLEKIIPQDKLIFEYLETPGDEKEAVMANMTKEQIDLAHYMQEYFANALKYLIQVKGLEQGRADYITHVRRGMLENIKEEGLSKAVSSMFTSMQEDYATFNIGTDQHILPLDKFFQYEMRRTGVIEPSENVINVFLHYVKTFEKMVSLNEIMPVMDIYAQSITPQIYTPKGLEFDKSIKNFVHDYINNKKGRRITAAVIDKQGGVVDVSLRAGKTVTSFLDLGWNIFSGLAATGGEQITNYQMLGARKFAKGNTRIGTKKGKAILKKYAAVIGRSSWEGIFVPGEDIVDRTMTSAFALFNEASRLANKQFILGSITDAEYNSGEITSERMTEVLLDMGRFRVVPGTKSLVGSTSVGGTLTQYKTWAIPVLRTNLKNLIDTAKNLKNRPIGEALTQREAIETYRLVGLTLTAYIVWAMVGADEEDDSFVGQLLNKVKRETFTLIQAVDPTLFFGDPRLSSFLQEFAKNIKMSLFLEEYKTRPGLKGVEGFKRQLTPRAIKQFQSKKEKRR